MFASFSNVTLNRVNVTNLNLLNSAVVQFLLAENNELFIMNNVLFSYVRFLTNIFQDNKLVIFNNVTYEYIHTYTDPIIFFEKNSNITINNVSVTECEYSIIFSYFFIITLLGSKLLDFRKNQYIKFFKLQIKENYCDYSSDLTASVFFISIFNILI